MTTPHHPFILASSSPRRLALLKDIGIVPHRVEAADVDETQHPKELPRALAQRLAVAKWRTVADRTAETALILAADTVVACGRRILPKAETEEDVRHCLQLLSGRRHRVFTAVVLGTPRTSPRQRLAESTVTFQRLSPTDIESYIACGEGLGKAGGYAIQGRAAAHIRSISGSYSNIVGLPLFEVAQMLKTGGYFPLSR